MTCIFCMYSYMSTILPIEQYIPMLFKDIKICMYPKKESTKILRRDGSRKSYDTTCSVP
jgi:hypothetical protein